MHLGTSEILLLLVIILVLFGSARFPKIMANLAEGLKTFKKSLNSKEKSKPVKKVAKKTTSVKGKK